MIIHTLVYSFAETMTEAERQAFFRELGVVIRSSGTVEGFDVKQHLPLPADEYAAVFVPAAIAQLAFADLDALQALSASTDLQAFIGRWQKKAPYQAVWVNHEPLTMSNP